MPLTSTVTVTYSPLNTTIVPEPYSYRMHCASWRVPNDLMEMPQVKCWITEQKVKPQKQTVKDRNTWFLWKAFVSKKAKNFLFVLSPSEKDKNDNTQWMDYQRLKPDNIFSIGIPPIPDFLLSLLHSQASSLLPSVLCFRRREGFRHSKRWLLFAVTFFFPK